MSCEFHGCFVGDSFINGVGDPEYLSWTRRTCAAARRQGHDLTDYNLGVRRETSSDIRTRWLREVACRLPEECDGRIVFSFGANDTTLENGKPRVELPESIENTHKILSGAKKRFPVLMVGPAPVVNAEQSQRIALISLEFARICGKLYVPYLDVLPTLQRSKVWLEEAAINDGSHPGATGYSELARCVQSWPAWLSWLE